MGELKADWRLRLRRGGADGPVCGAGVLLTRDRALTCAHVVGEPDTRIWVEFAENPAIAPVGARVAEGGWLPGLGATREDIAVLALDSPRPHATPATLERSLERGDEVWIGGYARSFADGMWLTGRISGAHGAWIQLDAARNEQVVKPGFSGAAVQVRGGPAGSPERVVGMVVSWRGDLDLALPADNDLAFSYMIPIDRIAELVPLVAELSGPDGWDHGLDRRLRRWFAGGDEPAVRFSVVPHGGGRDRTLKHHLHRAHLVYRGGRTTPEDFTDELVTRLRPPRHLAQAYRDWLLAGGTPPERPADGEPGSAGPTLAVTGLDEDPRPLRLVPLLARVRTLGFRLLVIVRDSHGEEVTEVARQLLLPALDEWAERLVRRVEEIETEWTGLNGLVESGSLIPLPRTGAARRRQQLARLRAAPDPHEQLRGLRALLRELRADLQRYGRAGRR
ncbi:serine protease [Streptomyces atratus]|uniref:Trypsin-like peptidase domain-containing protein n=1 Tax=Streptomyces atratus TaxID=1893 RepID=A0A1K2DUU4_STRAR|nr:serine protease [Streptomyces atratus]SFY26317.1 Trypsin-like peptidase domain-containing protein [Streptomyces atratus]